MNIAIFSYGTVGSGIKEIIDHAVTKSTKQLRVFYILIRKGKAKTLPYMCNDTRTVLQDTFVDVIVETIGGLEPAHMYILQILKSGRYVVTANEAIATTYLKGFTNVAREHNVRIYYEVNTGGGIPWTERLTKAMRIDGVDRIHGIFNGISSYILDHMQRYHAFFENILKEAQELGYAEADPNADIDGYNICNKLHISASLVYDYHVPDAFPVFNIRDIAEQGVSYFSSLGYTVRLIVKTRHNANRYGCVVESVLFGAGSLESSIQDNYNLITLHGKTIGDLKFFGQGARKLPTTDTIIQDLINLKEGVCHVDPPFTNTISYDGTLCLRDCILHVDEMTRDELQGFSYEMKAFEGQEYLHIQKVEVYETHQVIEQMLETDVHASMASIYEREGG